jgi:hypothetical protein
VPFAAHRLIPLAAVAALALSAGQTSLAQEEMPKDSAPDPAKKPPVQAPAVTPPALTPQAGAPAGTTSPDDQPPPPPPGTMTDEPMAVLQALDKVTARVKRIDVNVGQSADFGTLSVKLDACRKAPPEDPPESAAFLEITDHKSNGPPQTVFSGWMFASSPALSAMDHPVYDISVVDCVSEATTAAASSTAPNPAPPSH